MNFKIDHVAIAAPSLEPLQAQFAALGLAADYGGPHSNGITHMALLGLPDGSYIELISSVTPNPPATAFWDQHIAKNGGPCAWAVEVDNVAEETKRIAALGIPVDGPAYYNRRRPDGRLVEWDLAFIGEHGVGAMLPFIIKDITPRDWRVKPSVSVAETDDNLVGIAKILLGVDDLAVAATLFRQVYGWPEPSYLTVAAHEMKLAYFDGQAVILAAPTSPESWLAKRLTTFGPSPVAYLIGTQNFAESCNRLPLSQPTTWFDFPLAWLDFPSNQRLMLGVSG